MTQKQLLEMEHLSIKEVKPGMFVHVHTEDGYMITPWFEGDDIKEYMGTVCMYMPIRETYDDYRIITVEEHNELEERQKEEEINRMNNGRLD